MSYPSGLGDLAAQRAQMLQDAFNRGDSSFLLTWINDVPAHPNASVALAKQLLAKLQVPQVSSGSLVLAPPGGVFSSVAAPSPVLIPPQYAPPPPDIFAPAPAPAPDGAFTVSTPAPAPDISNLPTAPAPPPIPAMGGMSGGTLALAALGAFFIFGRKRG